MKLSEKVVVALLGKLISGLFSFATGILLARMLTRVDFGTYQQAMLIVAYVTPLALFGIDQSVTFFIPRLQDDRDIKTFIYQTTVILFLIGLLVSTGLFFSSGWISSLFGNDHLKPVLAIFSLYPIFNFPFSIVSLVLYSLDKQKLAATFESLSSSTQFVVIAILVAFEIHLRVVFLALVLLAVIKMVVSIFIYHRCVRNSSRGTFSKTLCKHQLRFSAPLGLVAVLPIVTRNLDKIVISAFYGVRDFAIYSVGAIELPFVALITYTMGNVISPKLSRLFYEKKPNEAVLIWHRMIHKTSLCLYPIFVFFMINAGDFIRLVYSEKYEGSTIVFQIYIFLLLVRISDNTAVIRSCDQTPILLRSSLLVFLTNLVLTFTLLRVIGILGPAVATVIAIYVNFAYIMHKLRHPLNLSFRNILPWNHMIKVLAISIICGLFVIPLEYALTSGFLNLLIKGFVYAGIYVSVTTRLGILEESDWELIKKYTGFQLIKRISKTVETV